MFSRSIPPSPSGAEILSAVVARGICKRFGRGATSEIVLNRTDFDVRAGEMTFLVGPSGCGKSTLLRLIAGLESPTRGEVMLGDKTINYLFI